MAGNTNSIKNKRRPDIFRTPFLFFRSQKQFYNFREENILLMKPKDYEFKFKKKFMSKKNFLLFLIAFFFSEKLFAQTPNFNWFPAAGAGTPVCAPATLIFIGGYTGSPAPTSLSWNFGAGAVPQTSNQQNPGLVNFTTCGTYNVTLTINGTISITQTVVIHCNPSACFIAMPSFGIVPTIVDFNSSCSQTTCQLSYQWDFGDAASSSLANPIHIYIDTGCFNIVMIVTDCNGCENDTMVLNAVCIAEPSSSLYNFVDNNFSFEIIPNPSDGNFSLVF